MDLRNLSSTPNQMDPNIQRRPSLSSLSSASGYSSSTYGTNNGNSTPQLGNQRLSSSSRNSISLQNSWLNQQTQNSSGPVSAQSNVGPWVEQQQKQQQSTLNTLDAKSMESNLKKEKSEFNESINLNNDETNQSTSTNDDDDELIPTAIVIKNIPFAIKKEQLLEVMTKLNLPLPYAFNYHFDNGVFRGLAFANFTSTDETSMVVNQLNSREIGGRKLRVEYKKMLPLQERERIEREKREKRGQLEEQHRTTSNASLASLMSAASTTAATKNLSVNDGQSSTTERLFVNLPSTNAISSPPLETNLNDPETLDLYNQLILFRDDVTRSVFELAFSTTQLGMGSRKVLSILCVYLGLLELFDNGLIIIRRKPGHVPQYLTYQPQLPHTPSHTNSVMNQNQGQTGQFSNAGHPELLRSQSQSAIQMPRLRQQSSTPIQQHFPQYQNQSQQPQQLATNQQTRPFSQVQPFNMYQQPQHQPQGQTQLQSSSNNQTQNNQSQIGTPTIGPTSAAALLRNTNSRSFVDMRSTTPLTGTFSQHANITESPTPQHAHQQFFPHVPNTSQPTTPLVSTDINARFQPFGQHSHLAGSFTSLQQSSTTNLDDYSNSSSTNVNDSLNNKFNSLNLSNNYDNSSGIWGPK